MLAKSPPAEACADRRAVCSEIVAVGGVAGEVDPTVAKLRSLFCDALAEGQEHGTCSAPLFTL
eukprot:2543713-Alexandrium_andersonii.AAC.1